MLHNNLLEDSIIVACRDRFKIHMAEPLCRFLLRRIHHGWGDLGDLWFREVEIKLKLCAEGWDLGIGKKEKITVYRVHSSFPRGWADPYLFGGEIEKGNLLLRGLEPKVLGENKEGLIEIIKFARLGALHPLQ